MPISEPLNGAQAKKVLLLVIGAAPPPRCLCRPVFPVASVDPCLRSASWTRTWKLSFLLCEYAPHAKDGWLISAGAKLHPDDLEPTQIDALPPDLDADFATRVDGTDFVHLECQGYKDPKFEERTVWYHIGFALRHRATEGSAASVRWRSG